ncbi:related to AVO2 Component of a complex containing the Tor2p kinase and other proteins, which may have a role in regulation of cell growth [Rhynchosporium graminicola]|uniref:Related to AVO2 Component of a complex containing the Tor2p kinase and other proteins, which may have a role in regulation of cell growth n=1 Tax=Rhynchosporium graminicola TaxID=2792576 RepID=A0A1E1LJT5_9HELO|nr:related to AVO2 Component of a complex containing the Tor2p kinase and other proteins, which may have a role in regulation of cell growth [Rhynchosporium commune]
MRRACEAERWQAAECGNYAPTMIDPSLRLRRAIHASDTLLVKRILSSHPNLLQNPDSSPTGLSNSNLHLASSLGHTSIVSLLLSLYAPPSSPPTTNPKDLPSLKTLPLNEEYQTPLHLAAASGHTEIVHLLCSSCPGCIKKGDLRGRDALMLASREGHDTVVQILLTFSPSGPAELLEASDIDGNTALHFASSNGHLLVLRTLLAAGADAEKRNVWSWTPVAYSATVQAEVYFKGLVSEVERRNKVRRDVREKGTGGGVRIVNLGDGEEM